MKRFLLLFAVALLLAQLACAESLPATTPTPSPTPVPVAEGELNVDFSVVLPENPVATPVAIDPIDKPTPTPAPTPDYVYETYKNEVMGLSFAVPYTWLLNPNTNTDTVVQFVEPKSEMMDVGGYQTRLTIEKVNTGLTQNAADARAQLEATLEQLASQGFSSFTPGNIASASIGNANGYYCYYKAEYNDGTKTLEMNGRIIIVAKDKALYQIRLTAPRNWFSYYNIVYRKIRNTLKFL